MNRLEDITGPGQILPLMMIVVVVGKIIALVLLRCYYMENSVIYMSAKTQIWEVLTDKDKTKLSQSRSGPGYESGIYCVVYNYVV